MLLEDWLDIGSGGPTARNFSLPQAFVVPSGGRERLS